jgi:hypothetical protein
MSDSLRRVFIKIKAAAREMRKEKHAKLTAPKPKEPPPPPVAKG